MKYVFTFFVLYNLLLSIGACFGQNVTVQNSSGLPWPAVISGSSFVFPVGATTYQITPALETQWSLDVYLSTLTDLTTNNNYVVLATATGSVNVQVLPLEPTVVQSLISVLTDPSVQNAFNLGLGFGASVVLTLFCFSFIRAIPGGKAEDF